MWSRTTGGLRKGSVSPTVASVFETHRSVPVFFITRLFVLSNRQTCPDFVHLLQEHKHRHWQNILYPIWYWCSTVCRRLIHAVISSRGWISKLVQTQNCHFPLCLNRLTQQIKTDYESTKINNNNINNNKNFKCIHVRNKYILNQNRIQFTVWIWKIQFSVSFVRQSVKDLKHCHVGNQNDLNWNLSIINPKCCYTQANKTCKTRPQNNIAIQNW